MPSYQDYVVARDDHDPKTAPTATQGRGVGSGRGTGTTPNSASNSDQSRVVRTRTFLIGNLDRGNMNRPSPSDELEVRVLHRKSVFW